MTEAVATFRASLQLYHEAELIRSGWKKSDYRKKYNSIRNTFHLDALLLSMISEEKGVDNRIVRDKQKGQTRVSSRCVSAYEGLNNAWAEKAIS